MRSLALALMASIGCVATPAMAQAPAAPRQDAPFATPSATVFPRTIGWSEGRTPKAPRGWETIRFAGGLDYPRQLLMLPNGDVLVSEARADLKADDEPERVRGQALSKSHGFSANRITLLRDADRDGVAEQRFVLMEGLNKPFGMAFANGRLYVANTDGVVHVPFTPGQTRVTAKPATLIALPAGGYNNHWTRNLLLSPDQRTLYVSVGSASNVGEHGMAEEARRAAILAVDLASGRERLYASGLRNPVGMDFVPGTATLWAAVNERDHFGDDISPDYIVGVKQGGFYGWPYSYWGRQDPRLANERRDLLAATLLPDLGVGPHAAALGLAFARDRPANAPLAYVARHGSWNRAAFSGYDVLAVPFADGRPSGEPQPFLTGFVADEKARTVYGRPVSVQARADGAVYVVDDAGDTVWLVRRAS